MATDNNAMPNETIAENDPAATPEGDDEPTLDDLLVTVNEGNRHAEVEAGPAAGVEVW